MATELKDYIKCYDGLFEHSFWHTLKKQPHLQVLLNKLNLLYPRGFFQLQNSF